MSAVDLRRFPWVRPLVTDYARKFESVAPLFAGNPADAGAWRDTIARVQRARRDRAALHTAIARQLDRRKAPSPARESADRLLDSKTVAVVTGQQAGVFGGPLYTILKAATAIQLARRVEREHGVAAVPVFWVDAEDHDWNEIKTARVLDANLATADVTASDPLGASRVPVGQLVFGPDISQTIDQLQAVLPPTEFTAEVMTAVRARYQPGARVGAAFAGWIEDLLGALGLVVFEADDPAAKPLARDVFVGELERPSGTAQLALEAGRLMQSLGHAPQVEPGADSVALFYMDADGRRPIRRQPGGFTIGDKSEAIRKAADLVQEAATHPERFSPNVLLRPIVQDRLFPTICYVAGPSELAYQAQLLKVYRTFDVEPPLLYSRASATLVDSAGAKFLERSDVPFEELHAQDEAALNRLLERQLPPGIDRTLAETEQVVSERIQAIKDAAAAVDPTLSGAVDTTFDRIRETLKHLQSKIVQASKRKDDTLRRQFMRTQALAFPGGDPQERAVSVVFFVNRYGLSLGERLLSLLPLETDKHYIITI